MEINELTSLVLSLSKSIQSLSHTVASNFDEISRQQKLMLDLSRHIDDLRADTRELMFENQRILRKLENL